MTEPLFSESFLAKIERLTLVARRVKGQGAARVDRKGGQLEFSEHRRYFAGDDLRYADWHLYGRLGRLFIKEFEREEEAEAVILIDLSGSMRGKIRGALRLGAALLTIALARGDRVRLGFAADGDLRLSRAVEGEGRRAEMLARLEEAEALAAGGTDLSASLTGLPPRRGPGRRLTILISDLLAEKDGREQVERLGPDAIVLHYLSPEERAPGPLGRVTLTSAEGGALEAYVGAAEAERYEREMETWRESLAKALSRRGCRYLLAPAELPAEDFLLHVLTAEGILR